MSRDVRQHTYRSAKQLPSTLLDHVAVAVEEGLYSQAFDVLYSALIAGTGTPRPGYVPPAQYVALATTLAVHPAMTTKTTAEDKHTAANDAMRYLLALNKVVGAKTALFRDVLCFGSSQDDRSSRLKVRKSMNTVEEPADTLRCVYTQQQSLVRHVDDFWQLLGWTLNCSLVLRRRWDRWKLLVNFMLDAFEDDLAYILAQAEQTANSDDPLALDNALILHHLSSVGERRDNRRKMMRAIFADATSRALSEFGEVFKDETAEPKKKTPAKRHTLNLDEGIYGDYDQDSDEELQAVELRRSTNTAVSPLTPLTNAYDFSDREATTIRLRMLVLLADVCVANPTLFLNLEELFDLYTEFIRPLPVQSFEIIVVGLGKLLDEDTQSSLYQVLLRAMIDASAPIYNDNEVNQEVLEKHFAPFAANSSAPAENAKVSLLIEGLLRLLWKHDMLTPTASLRQSIFGGVQARQEKVNFSSRQGDTSHEYEEQCLRSSGDRMLSIVDAVKAE